MKLRLFKESRLFVRDCVNFSKRLVSYLPILWEDRDFDYGYVLKMMFFKLNRLREHILRHDLIVEAEQVGAEILYAQELYDRYLENKDMNKEEELWNEFFNYLRDHIRNWWD